MNKKAKISGKSIPKYDKEKFLTDLASTPLISIGLGEITLNPIDYVIEEIKFEK